MMLLHRESQKTIIRTSRHNSVKYCSILTVITRRRPLLQATACLEGRHRQAAAIAAAAVCRQGGSLQLISTN